jgi:hypothetical protein
MELEELNYQERALIEILRAFEFLHNESYHAKEISFGSRSNPSVIYYNYIKNMKLHVIGDESQSWSVTVQREKNNLLRKETNVFNISDIYKYFNNGLIKGRNYSLKTQTDFIRKYLMPVIRGEIWIDELVKNV